uniref:Uncharacterized protein n=1 Tax=Tanacetum cinerariifolium TaxID=118510 RepID=A0A699H4Q6_TANCI|nr:hypothetical protein [Tanacetum cinerariifolium]
MSLDLASSEEPDSPKAAPASPDYVPSPKEPEQAPPLPDYPYVDYASPVALSPGYVANSDPEEDSEDGPVDYPAYESDNDDVDDFSDDDEEEEASEEEEHLALADFVVAPAVDPVPSSEEIASFETDESATTPPPPHADHTTPLGAGYLSDPRHLCLFYQKERLARCLDAPALPSSLYLRPPVPTSLPLPSPPLPPLPASLFIPQLVDRKEDNPEAKLPTCKRLCLTAPTLRYELGESSTTARPTGDHRADYGFIGTLDAETRHRRAEEVGYCIRDVWRVSLGDCVVDGAEALVFREAWVQSMGLSLAVHQEL